MAVTESRRREIRRLYRMWRAAVDLNQGEVEDAVRRIYPEFPRGAFWRIENGQDFPTPTARKALAKVLKRAESDLPAETAERAIAS